VSGEGRERIAYGRFEEPPYKVSSASLRRQLQRKRRGRDILVGDVYVDVSATEFLQAIGDGSVNDFRAVAIAAEVAEVELLEIGVENLFQHIGGSII